MERVDGTYSFIGFGCHVLRNDTLSNQLEFIRIHSSAKKDMRIKRMICAVDKMLNCVSYRNSNLITKSSGKISRNFLSPPNLSLR
jgi:hypothetical protein